MDIFADVLSAECIHGLTKRTCSICLERLGWGHLHHRPYRTHLADLYPEKYPEVQEKVRYCEECKHRGACKGNRVNVRLPRGRVSFAVGAPVYPPSWDGPLVTKPKVRRATHRKNGRWVCDRCDSSSPVRENVVDAEVLGAKDIFA